MTDAHDRDDAVRFAASRAYRARALDHLAFGVSSTPRAVQLPVPVVVDRAEGAHVIDADGNRYVDYALGYGPLILGHSPRPVIEALHAELAKGLRTASVHRGEAELAELIAHCMPAAEQTTFVSTGTEAVQLALRIARAATGRTKIAKFRANYHGWFDSMNVAARIGNDGPGGLGQDPGAAGSIIPLDWGDAGCAEATLDRSFAAVIVEPVAINAGCFEPRAGFLEALRHLTRRHGIVLIFDEVISGFRLALGGAQEKYGVVPDLSVLGKALGAGLPISAVSGSRGAMAAIAGGGLAHRGTFNGNPLSIAAAIACLTQLAAGRVEIYPRLHRFATDIREHLNAAAADAGLKLVARQAGPAVQIFARVGRMDALADTAHADPAATLEFTGELLRAGVMTLPRGLMYFSTAHTDDDIAQTRVQISKAVSRFAARDG